VIEVPRSTAPAFEEEPNTWKPISCGDEGIAPSATLSNTCEMDAGPAAIRVELVPDSDMARADEATAALRRELLELDVERVERETSDAPAGSKGLELGALVITLANAGALSGVVQALKAWASRGGRRLKLEVEGDTIEISGATSEQQERLIAAWIDRQERS
jgi:membrane-associated two-gene conflict system component 1 (EACC1)